MSAGPIFPPLVLARPPVPWEQPPTGRWVRKFKRSAGGFPKFKRKSLDEQPQHRRVGGWWAREFRSWRLRDVRCWWPLDVTTDGGQKHQVREGSWLLNNSDKVCLRKFGNGDWPRKFGRRVCDFDNSEEAFVISPILNK